MKNISGILKKALKRCWLILSRDLFWKALSVVLALILWSYIISVDSSITRVKTLSDVEITTTGLTVLQGRDLALLTDVTSFGDVHVRVEASQSAYARISNKNVRVELDLSQITKPGVQQVDLVGVTAYGKVIQVLPSSVEVTVEARGSRYVPVNVEFIGEMTDDYWYNVSRTNPAQVMVSGPSSLVQTVASARVQVDVTGQTASYDRSSQLTLLDDQGSVVGSHLTASPSFIMLGMDIYPKIQLKVDDSPDTATIGSLPEGYVISGVDVQPDVVTVAADSSLLSELDGLNFTPVNVDGRTSSFSSVATLNTLRDLRYISSEQVTITIYIEEITSNASFGGIDLSVRGAQDAQTVSLAANSVDVTAAGLYSLINKLDESDIQAFVDVTGLEPGTHEVPVSVVSLSGKDVAFTALPASVSVTIEE